MMIDMAEARAAIRAQNLAGWLLYDFQGLNPLARAAAGLGADRFLTRRWFCLIPGEGEPRWLVHVIERTRFAGVPGSIATYAGRADLEDGLRALLRPGGKVAMEYSPEARVPSISRVDAGTIELVRIAGAEVVSSGDLVQALLARWPARGRALHEQAARHLEATVKRAFEAIGTMLREGRTPTEVGIQRRIVEDLTAADLISNAPPIVAVGAHAADPHYVPGEAAGHDAPIERGAVVLIDVWAKKKGDRDAIYADMTFMGYTGDTVPERAAGIWRTVAAARDRALETAQSGWREKRGVRGFEVDRAARQVVEAAGLGAFFTHRTGHSLGIEDHWIGANMDDFETHEERRLVAGTGFTIEPGIYLPGEFGMRTEIDVFVAPDKGPIATTALQRDLVLVPTS